MLFLFESIMSKFSQSWHYLRDKCRHTPWNPEAPPNLEVEEDITGKIVIVTGANSGIGRETAYQLAKRGAKVILACRNLDKAFDAKKYIESKVPTADLEIMQLDLGDLDSVREFVTEFESKYERLDILVNNAGVFMTDNVLHKTKNGFEAHMGTNHCGPFLLTNLLIPSLRKGAPSRIVCVSSSQMILAQFDLDDLMMEKGLRSGLDGSEPYNISKLANSVCMRVLASKLAKDKGQIRVFQLCPGLVSTDVFRNDGGFFGWMRKMMLGVVGVGPEHGCETVVHCSVNKKLGSEVGAGNGEMYRFCTPYLEGTNSIDAQSSKALPLFEKSKELVGLPKS